MGWGAAVHARRALLGDCCFSHEKALPRCDFVAVDGNAFFRRQCVGTSPVAVVVRRVVDLIVGCSPSLVGVYFDDASRMPAVRQRLWDERYRRPAPVVATDDQVAAVTPRSMNGTTWQALFASPAGKRRMFEMLYAELIKAVRVRSGANAAWIVTRPNFSSAWTYPFDDEPSVLACAYDEQQYGEAECQLVMSVRRLIYTAINTGAPIPVTTVLTIDTDIALQLAGAYTPHVHAAWAKVWVSGDVVARTAKKAPPGGEAMWEVVTTDTLFDGQTQSSMAWRLFGWLCAGGVDYCAGLGGFGWPLAAVEALLRRPSALTVLPGGTLQIDVGALAAALASTRKSRRKEDIARGGGGGALADELDRILYCVRYFSWIDSTRPNRGGPEEAKLFPNDGDRPTTVTEWLARAAAADAVTVTEAHPPRLELAPIAPDGPPSHYLRQTI